MSWPCLLALAHECLSKQDESLLKQCLLCSISIEMISRMCLLGNGKRRSLGDENEDPAGDSLT